MPKRTALYERHEALEARIVDFAGWLLPVQYPTGPVAEHHAVRQAAGLFDIDHMGQVVVSGPDALAYLQYLMTADVAAIAPRAAHYSLMCYADGGVVDDVFIYHLTAPERYFVAINAANVKKDVRWMLAHTMGYNVRVENMSDETYMLALQGPASEAILNPLCDSDLSALGYHSSVETAVAGVPTLVGRTGYTGEDGFELFFPTSEAGAVWDALMAAGAPHGLLPIGLAARDSLRLEPCMPLYGQEISATRDPIGAGLGWAVHPNKGAFIGRDALLKIRLEGPKDKLVAFEMVDRGVPRHDYPVAIDGVEVGVVTSGIKSPTLDAFVGMAYVPAAHSAVGSEFDVIIRDRPKAARVMIKPLVAPSYRR